MKKMRRPEQIDSTEKSQIEKRKDQTEICVQEKKPRTTKYETATSDYETLKSRSTPKPIINLIKQMNEEQKQAIREIGFGSLLDWSVEEIPMKLAYWLVKNFNPLSGKLKMGKRNAEVRITSEDVELYLGLPRGEKKIVVTKTVEDEELLIGFQSQFEKITNEDTGELILKKTKDIKQKEVADLILECNEPDDWFKRNFVMLFLSTVIESNSNYLISCKVLDCLKDTSTIKDFDWCEYVLKVLIDSTCDWNKKQSGNFRGPILLLLIVYVDRMVIKGVESARDLPIIKNWTSEKLRERQNEEARIGDFGLGFVRGSVMVEEKSKQNAQENKGKEQVKENIQVGENEDTLLAFLEKYISEGKDLALSIRKFINLIKTAPSELSSNLHFKRVNEAVEKMLNVQISPLMSSGERELTQEEEESASQIQFWEQAEKCLEEIEKTIKEKGKSKSPSHSFGVKDKEWFEVPSFDLGLSPIRDVNENAKDWDQVMNIVDKTNDELLRKKNPDEGTSKSNLENQDEEIVHVEKDIQKETLKDLEKDKETRDVSRKKDTRKVHFEDKPQDIDANKAVRVFTRNTEKRVSKLSETQKSPFKKRAIQVNEKLTSIESKFYEWMMQQPKLEQVFHIGLYIGTTNDFKCFILGQDIEIKAMDMFCQYLNAQEEERSTGSPFRLFIPQNDVAFAVMSKNTMFSARLDWFTGSIDQYMTQLKIKKVEDIDMIFFPIKEDERYYVIAVNLKNPRMDILDIDATKGSIDEIYRFTPEILRSLIVGFLERKDMLAKSSVFNDTKKFPFTRLEMPWRSGKNKKDSGIFNMRHMETYFGNGLTGWESQLAKGNKKQVETMRVKYLTAMISSKYNQVKIDVTQKIATTKEKK